ncbi:MAG: tyrosine--tRNA ligase [Alphaproteobacteria bacterium]|nr:tyrosine--tRNA ligase [Alphaproteobacteria bacterium]
MTHLPDLGPVADMRPHDALREAAKRPLRVKLGIDPTASGIHLGFAVVLRALRAFQDAGHTAVLIVGDATARVGDPSGKDKTRPMLTDAEVRANAATYLDQIGQILDMESAEIRFNSTWFDAMPFQEVIALCGQVTVAQVLARDSTRQRLDAGAPVGLHELVYPVMQAFDSVQVRADVELGGSDQLFNLMMGRDLQPRFGQAPQIAVMMPLLVGLDGARKMSKSHGNTIGITEAPEEQFGKAMSIPDDAVPQWLELAAGLSPDEARTALAEGPLAAKRALAWRVVARCHGSDAADGARAHFDRVVVSGEIPADILEHRLTGASVWVVALVAELAGVSRSQARRLMQQGAVRLGDERLLDPEARRCFRDGEVLQTGRRRWHRLRVSDRNRTLG